MTPPQSLCLVRPTTEADIPAIIDLQRRVFPKMPPWTEKQLRSHLDLFPEGQAVAVSPDGRIIGSSSSLILVWDHFDDLSTWTELTARGMFTTHAPRLGKTLYGADIGVDPEARGMGVGTKLYEARKKLVQRLNLKRMIAGGRIPGYREVADHMTAEQYVADVVAGNRRDQVLSFQLHHGFTVSRVIPGYLGFDKPSMGYGTLIQWVNPAYRYASVTELSRHPRTLPAAL
jgi:ribosomal protein S18 acetylase RimI-like enzyme